MDKNEKNLPVLYTIPKWKMKLTVPGKKRKLYFIPELNKYVDTTHVSYYLPNIGKTPQEWYDRWMLDITVPSDRPKVIDGRTARFRDLCFGYAKTQAETSVLTFNEWLSEWNKARDRASKNSTNGQVNRYKRPEEREKTSSSSRLVWRNPSDKLINNSLGSYKSRLSAKVYSKWEGKEITFDSSWEVHLFNKVNNLDGYVLVRTPFTVQYESPNDLKSHNYLPDFLLNNHYLIEIKPNYLLDDEVNIAKFNAADLYCRENGLEYVILTEDYLFNNGEPFYGSMPF